MEKVIFIVCMTLLALRILSSIDKQKDVEIWHLRKEIKRLGGNYNGQRINNNQTNRGVHNYNERR